MENNSQIDENDVENMNQSQQQHEESQQNQSQQNQSQQNQSQQNQSQQNQSQSNQSQQYQSQQNQSQQNQQQISQDQQHQSQQQGSQIQEQEVHEEQQFQQQQQQQQQQNDGNIIRRLFESEDKASYIMEIVVEREGQNEDEYEILSVIEVIKAKYKKAYIGGYKSVKTNKTYHHGIAQTDQIQREYTQKFERQTQTYEQSTKSTKVKRENGSQMTNGQVYIDARKDKVMVARQYFTSEMWKERREEAALFIQRLVRSMLARQKTNQLRQYKLSQIQSQLDKEEEFRMKEEIRHKEEIQRRMHPLKQNDFDILYQELEVWRLLEVKKVKQDLLMTEEQQHGALREILAKETELLQTIDRLKIQANKENREIKIQQFLKSMADPKLWLRSDGRYTEVHTPFTTRAKELMNIFNGLKVHKIPVDERLDILLNTKWTVKEYKTELTREIEELIDREADMINRGRPEKSLEGLRQRLSNLFLTFIETPEYNPEAARFQKIPYELLMINHNDNQ